MLADAISKLILLSYNKGFTSVGNMNVHFDHFKCLLMQFQNEFSYLLKKLLLFGNINIQNDRLWKHPFKSILMQSQ